MSGPAFDVPLSALVGRSVRVSRERDRIRRARPRSVRARTIGRREVAALAAEEELFRDGPDVDYERPATRGECVAGPRPCPFVSCRFHLYLDVNRAGGLKLNFPDLEVGEMAESCALDVADRGGATFDAIRSMLNVTRQAAQIAERRAIESLAAAMSVLMEEARSWPR